MKIPLKVTVIGAGVNGLSTAYLLLKAGYEVTIISKHDPLEAVTDSTFASLFPSASVIPHSVYSENLISFFNNSLIFFEKLKNQNFPGVGVHEHFELFSNEKPLPSYADCVHNYVDWSDFKNDWHPSHPTYKIHTGWKFDCFFADWKLYYPALLKTFIENGGEIQTRELTQADVEHLDAEIIVNCSGLGSIDLFGEENALIYSGHLVSISKAPVLKNKSGQTVSYNLTPGPEIYSNENGEPLDVYCYPRQDGWILGGSRMKGSISQTKEWIGEKDIDPKIQLNDIAVPTQIIELNRDIIKHSFNINLEDYSQRKAMLGYRYVRLEENGLRMEKEEKYNKLIVHNYGHGGAGVTLSWGCAREIVSIISKETS